MAEKSDKRPSLRNDLLIRAALSQPTPRAPVWVMRQAGRYLPEFRAIRAEYGFFEICRTPSLACEITLQPIRRYAGLLDAAIIFSDILVVPQALGLEVIMLPGEGPHFPNPVASMADAEGIIQRPVDVHAELGYVFDALRLTHSTLAGEVPLIGFCGAPWTLFAYMIEGGGSKTFQKAKTWLWNHPDTSKALLTKISNVCAEYLVGQIVNGGADLVQIFDSWAGELSPTDFQQFSLPYLRMISHQVRAALDACSHPHVPMTVFAKGANHALIDLAHSEYDVIGLDWTIDPIDARKQIASARLIRPVAVQGNLDPSLLYASREAIEREVIRMCQSFGRGTSGWIANLGHGITPSVDPEIMRWFLECVHRHSASP